MSSDVRGPRLDSRGGTEIDEPADPRPAIASAVDDFDRGCIADSGDELERGRGTVFMVAGTGGGESLYPVRADDPEADYFATAMGRNSPSPRSGFPRLRLTSDALAGSFVGSTPGSFRDRFVIGLR